MGVDLKAVVLKCVSNIPIVGDSIDLDFALAVVGRSMITYGVYANCKYDDFSMSTIDQLPECFCVTITDVKRSNCHVIAYEDWFYKVLSGKTPDDFELRILNTVGEKIGRFVIFDK